MARRSTTKTDIQNVDTAPTTATQISTTRRRLTENDRQKIRDLHAAGKTKSEIASEVSTSPATVGKVLGVTRSTRRVPGAAQADTLTPVQRRMITLAIRFLNDETIDDVEKTELRGIVQERIEQARNEAVQQALATL